jgi:hypothetical protein
LLNQITHLNIGLALIKKAPLVFTNRILLKTLLEEGQLPPRNSDHHPYDS